MGITKVLAKKLINYESEKSPAFKFRQKRAERIKKLIEICYEKYGRVNMIDVGGKKVYWKILPTDYLKQKNVQITLVNLPGKETFPPDDQLFKYREGDGSRLTAFSDQSFHIAHSNSVIEHVGSNEKMRAFAEELKRVGEYYYLQTPNYWFPLEPHFVTPLFHWMPRRLRIFLLMNFSLAWYPKAKTRAGAENILKHCRLLKKKHIRQLFPEGTIYKEKFLFLVKSFIVINKQV